MLSQMAITHSTCIENNFSSMVSLIVHDYIMHSFSFNFFSLFGNIRSLRIDGHLLYRKELEEINKCCEQLKCIHITIHDPISCAELIECNKDKFEIVSLHLGYTNVASALWNALAKCTKLKVLRIRDALLLQSDIDLIFPNDASVCENIQIIEIQTYDWSIHSHYEMKAKFPALKAFQRIDPMLYELKAVRFAEESVIHIHDFRAIWFEETKLWQFQWT